eukprot:TRINITY_DN7445_c0_g2_i1.p1 TRINITY_DN7445_c0_g2~~TRINITY_DN7445_c0_g2_i1.p1  ORF type:complete len:210 (+),score=29.79 TRINITY_DN7445_c0_g2_i1:82-711(+)
MTWHVQQQWWPPLAQAGAPQPQPAPPQAPVGGKGAWDLEGGWGAKGGVGAGFGYNDSWWYTGKGKGCKGQHAHPGAYGNWKGAKGFGKGAFDTGGGAAAGSGYSFTDPYSWADPGEREWHADGGVALSRGNVDSGDRDSDTGCADECPACCSRSCTVRLECKRYDADCPGWRACYECAFRQAEEGGYSVPNCPLCRERIMRRIDECAQG